jgi:hypothetical protein
MNQANSRSTCFFIPLSILLGCGGPGSDPAADVGDGPGVEGTYRLDSHIALPPDYLAGPAPLLDGFLAMTDDPHDPATWILDRVEDQLGFFARQGLGAARAALDLDALANEYLLDHSPQLIVQLVRLGGDLTELSRSLELESRLTVRAGASTALIADHRLVGVGFMIDGARADVDLTAAGVALPPPATGVAVEVSSRQIAIARHTFAIDEGALLRFGLDRVLLPAIDPRATSVTTWLAGEVGCSELGAWLEEIVEVGSPEDYARACTGAIAAGVDEIIGGAFEIEAELALRGRATLADDGDAICEALDAGAWDGSLALSGGAASALPAGSSFVGVRE